MKKIDHSSVIIGNLQSIGKSYKVGFPTETTGGQKYENGATLASVAAFNEYGHGETPPRPFMKNAADDFESEPNVIRDAIERGVVRDGDRAAGLLAVQLTNKIKEQISRGSFDANAQSTVAKKGSSRPLVDTGKMLGGVDFVESN